VFVAAVEYPISRLCVAWQVVLSNVFDILSTVQRRTEKTCDITAAQKSKPDSNLLNTKANAGPNVSALVEETTQPVAVAGSRFGPFFGRCHAEHVVEDPQGFWDGSTLLELFFDPGPVV